MCSTWTRRRAARARVKQRGASRAAAVSVVAPFGMLRHVGAGLDQLPPLAQRGPRPRHGPPCGGCPRRARARSSRRRRPASVPVELPMNIFTPAAARQAFELRERVGVLGVAPMKKAWSHQARPLARASLSSSAASLSVLGLVLGISNTAVTPPSTAARVPVERSSLCSRPGSRKWHLAVDDAGQHVQPGGVEGGGGRVLVEAPDRRDLAVAHADIGRDAPGGRQAGPARDDQVIAFRHARLLSPTSSQFAGDHRGWRRWRNLGGLRTLCEAREHVTFGRAAKNVAAMPQRVEQQGPGGTAGASRRIAEQRLDRVRRGRLRRCRAGDATSGPSRAPCRAIQSPTGTVKPCLRDQASAWGTRSASQLRSRYLAEAAPQLQRVGQAEGGARDHGIEKRRAPLDAMRHQAAVELDQQIVGQPAGDVDGLCRLQARCARRAARRPWRIPVVAPSRSRRAARRAVRVRRARAAGGRAGDVASPAIAAIAGEQLVATFAGQHDLHLRRRDLASL